jgi:acyl-CoA synthetase (AMP-forming)/AMP-acid ligase II
MKSTMMAVPLSTNTMFARMDKLFGQSEVISRLPDKRLVRHSFTEIAARTRALAHALKELGIKKGDCVATLCWNHNVHLECYFGIPLAGAVMHTLNLRLSGEEIAWIAGHAKDRVLIVDDILLSLYRQVAERYRFEKVIVFPFGGEPIPDDCANYETLIAPHLGKPFTPAPHDENDPIALCYTSGTTGRPKGVAYSHRSTVLHSLNACLPDYWGLPMFHGLDQIRDGADRARARIREAGHCRKRSAHH